jgi:hypothetical protein
VRARDGNRSSPRACDDDGRRQIPVSEAGDGMRDRRWRLGRSHIGTGGEAGDGGRGRSRSSPVGAMAVALGCRMCSCDRPLDAAAQLLPRTRTKGSALAGAELRNGGEHARVSGSGTKGGDPAEWGSSSSRSLRITIMADGEGGGAPDHDERHWRWVPDLRAHTTEGGEIGGNRKVEQRGSQIRARFWRRWPEEGDPAAAAARGTGRGGLGAAARFFIHTVGRGRTRCVTVFDASRRPGLCISVKLIFL